MDNRELLNLVRHLDNIEIDEGDNYGYVEPPSLDDIRTTWKLAFEDVKKNEWGLPEYPIGKPFNEKTIKEFERKKEMKVQSKPKAEYCDLCGKEYKQMWDSVTGKYYCPDKHPFIDKFICGSCAFEAREWFFIKRDKKITVVQQEEKEIKLESKEEPKKKVDKTSFTCDNCLYKIRDCKMKCNSCNDYSNYKEYNA